MSHFYLTVSPYCDTYLGCEATRDGGQDAVPGGQHGDHGQARTGESNGNFSQEIQRGLSALSA